MNAQDPETLLLRVQARSHPLKVKLLHLLSIYRQLSPAELAEKTGKSKPTVLKHLSELENMGEVSYVTETSPGAYDKRIYSLTHASWTIQGQNLRETVRQDPQKAIGYINYQLSQLLQIKDMVDSMVEYQKRLNEQVLEAIDADDGDELIELMRDHLGQRGVSYKTRRHILEGYLTTEKEPEVSQVLQALSQHVQRYPDPSTEPKSHVTVSFTFPIQRVIEQTSQKQWIKDGQLWF